MAKYDMPDFKINHIYFGDTTISKTKVSGV